MKKIFLLFFIILILTGCSSGRKYNGSFSVNLSVVSELSSSLYDRLDFSDYFKELSYEYKSKDKIFLRGKMLLDNEWKSFEYTAIQIDDVHDSEEVDKSTNTRYKTKYYYINAVPSSETAFKLLSDKQSNIQFFVSEYICDDKSKSHIQLDSSGKNNPGAIIGNRAGDLIIRIYQK